MDPVPWAFLSCFPIILTMYQYSSKGFGGVFWDGRAQVASFSVQISQGLLGVVAVHLLLFGEDDVALCPSPNSTSCWMPEKSPPWPSSFSRTDISKPNMGLAPPGLPQGVPKTPLPAVAPLPLMLMLSAELSCAHSGIITNILSKMFCSVDFTPSSTLWCIMQVLLLLDCIAMRAVPDKHFFCLLWASDPSGGWTRSSDASFDIPCLSYGNESSWNGLVLSLAMLPSCLSGWFLFPIAPGAVQRLLWSLKSLPVSLSRESQKTVPDGSLRFTLNFDAWCVFSHAGLVCNTSRSAPGQHCVFLFFFLFLFPFIVLCLIWYSDLTRFSLAAPSE